MESGISSIGWIKALGIIVVTFRFYLYAVFLFILVLVLMRDSHV